MEFGKFWEEKTKKQRLYQLNELEFNLFKTDKNDSKIMNQMKTFLRIYSDIDIISGKQFKYTEDDDKFTVSIKYPYQYLEATIKEYFELLEEYGYLEWI